MFINKQTLQIFGIIYLKMNLEGIQNEIDSFEKLRPSAGVYAINPNDPDS